MGNIPMSSWMNKPGKMIDNDFPSTARTALIYLLSDLRNKNYLEDPSSVILELNRIGRFTEKDLLEMENNPDINGIHFLINKLDWERVYYFCERVYTKLLREVDYGINGPFKSIVDVQEYFSDEITTIIKEENLAFTFVNGQFQRRGRVQTQKLFERMGAVLTDNRLEQVKNHYNKSRRFFDLRPTPDLENCIKEALCAFEASIEILTSKNASGDFDKAIKQLEGNGSNQIPYPIGDSMIKLHSYRGSGQGVAHASLQGNKVSMLEAELTLNIVASYISYLVDLFPLGEELSF